MFRNARLVSTDGRGIEGFSSDRPRHDEYTMKYMDNI